MGINSERRNHLISTDKATDGFGEVWDWPDLVMSEYQEPAWYIDQLIPEGGKIIIAAKHGIGKSLFGQQLSLHLAAGVNFLGLSVLSPRKVVYVQCEGDLGDTSQRGRDMMRMMDAPIPPGMLTWAFHMKRKLNSPGGGRMLKTLCEQAGLEDGLLIIDPIYKTIRGSMKDDDVVGEWQGALDTVLNAHRSAGLIFQHEHRPMRNAMGDKVEEDGEEKVFGSAFWHAWASYGYELARLREKGQFRFLNWKRRRPTALSEAETLLTLVEPAPLGFVLAEPGVSSTAQTIKNLTKSTRKVYNRAELQALTGRGTTAVHEAVNSLCDTGAIEIVDGVTPTSYRWVRG